MSITINRGTLFEFLKLNSTSFADPQLSFILIRYLQTQAPSLDVTNSTKIKQQVSFFLSNLKKRWNMSSRTSVKFLTQNKSWLNEAQTFECPNPLPVTELNAALANDDVETMEAINRGRPRTSFDDASERSKRRKTESLRQLTSSELLYAGQMKLRADGNVASSILVKHITSCSPSEAEVLRSHISKKNSELTPYTTSEALAMYLDTQLSKQSYQQLRIEAINHGADIYPSYHKLLEEKRACYPNGIEISVQGANIPLQLLLDHTLQRLCQVLQPEFSALVTAHKISSLSLTGKWGLDGATGQSTYKQGGDGMKCATDASIFITSYVPLQLAGLSTTAAPEIIIWTNQRPSSTQFCRPISFLFTKETSDLTIEIMTNIKSQIQHLEPTIILQSTQNLPCNHILHMTMIDGKIATVLSEKTKSTMCCPVCGASPKDMNNLDKFLTQPLPSSESLDVGLSTLHCWIRFFEFLLHLGYRIPFQTWSAKGDDKKEIIKVEKARIAKQFHEQLGLIVDKPRSGGSGNSNDGNTARKAFHNPDIMSKILNVDIKLVKNLATILGALSSGLNINAAAFKEFALTTAHHYVALYPWFYMPQSVHRVLIHGYLVIDSFTLPIGMMSEEAQESRNKDFKKYREHHSRKISREQTNQDLINRLLMTSDPFISSIRRPKQRHHNPLGKDILQLLVDSSLASNKPDDCCSDDYDEV